MATKINKIQLRSLISKTQLRTLHQMLKQIKF